MEYLELNVSHHLFISKDSREKIHHDIGIVFYLNVLCVLLRELLLENMY